MFESKVSIVATGARVVRAWALPAILFIVFYTQADRVRIWDPDESYYAQGAREMVRRGDLMNPVFNGENFWHKPAFFYWCVGLSQWIGGDTEHAIRFASALAAALTGFIVFRWARRGPAGEAGGWASVVILATTLEFFAFAHIATPDMALTLFLVWSLHSLYMYIEEGGCAHDLLMAWVAGGLGTLDKGPVGIVLPLLCAVVYLVLTKRPRRVLSLFRAGPLIVFSMIALPWYVYMAARYPDYFRVFFLEHNVQRFTSDRWHHAAPIWYFLPVLAIGVCPWLFHLLSEFRGAVRERFRLFALVSVVVIVAFFSPSGSKLPGYILVAIPLAAVVAGPAVLASGRRLAILTLLLWMQVAAIVAVLLNGSIERFEAILRHVRGPSMAMLLVGLAAAVLVCSLLPRRSWLQVAAGLCALLVYESVMRTIEPYKPAEKILRDVASRGSPPLASLSLQRSGTSFLPSLMYYRDSTVIELRDRSELLSFFKRKERVLCVAKEGDFRLIPWESYVPLYRIANYIDINYEVVMISNRPDQPSRQR